MITQPLRKVTQRPAIHTAEAAQKRERKCKPHQKFISSEIPVKPKNSKEYTPLLKTLRIRNLINVPAATVTGSVWAVSQPWESAVRRGDEKAQEPRKWARLPEHLPHGVLITCRGDWKWCPIFKKISIGSSGQKDAIFLWNLIFQVLWGKKKKLLCDAEQLPACEHQTWRRIRTPGGLDSSSRYFLSA